SSLMTNFKVHDAAELSEYLQKACQEQKSRFKFDLQNVPLFRVVLIKHSFSDFLLFLQLHHLIADMWSLAVLTHELTLLYRATVEQNHKQALPAIPSYADYVQWQQAMLMSPRAEKLKCYWRTQLAGELPVLNLPTDHLRPSIRSFSGASQSFVLNAQLVASLKQLSLNSTATLYMTLLAGFQILLGRLSGQDDLLVSSP